MPLERLEDLEPPILVCSIPIRSAGVIDYPPECEAIELRLDYLGPNLTFNDDLKRLIEAYASKTRTIITIREVEEGGVHQVPLDLKARILEYSKSVGALIDVEAYLARAYETFRDLAKGSILSRHVYRHDIDIRDIVNDDLMLAKAVGAYAYKIFSISNDHVDYLLRLLLERDRLKPLRLAVVPASPILRVISMLLETEFMYCSTMTAVAPGQLNIGLCKKVKRFKRELFEYFK